MKKVKFKEYRMWILCLIILVVFMTSLTLSVLSSNKLRVIASGIMCIMSLVLVMLRYYIIVDDDYMVNYKWTIVAMLPYVIDYKDIIDIKKISKHCVVIEHGNTSKVYVRNADQLMNELNKRIKEEKEND